MNVIKSIFITLVLLIPGGLYGQSFSVISDVVELKYPKIIDLKSIPEKKSSKWNLGSKKWTKESLVSHLLKHDNHRNKYRKKDLEKLTLKQLWFIHDEDHEGRQVKFSFPEVITLPPLNCPKGVT
tara:strand:- start:242 stop:616 length:375 start_codon:yes stop_codon:yes gene_type:complete